MIQGGSDPEWSPGQLQATCWHMHDGSTTNAVVTEGHSADAIICSLSPAGGLQPGQPDGAVPGRRLAGPGLLVLQRQVPKCRAPHNSLRSGLGFRVQALGLLVLQHPVPCSLCPAMPALHALNSFAINSTTTLLASSFLLSQGNCCVTRQREPVQGGQPGRDQPDTDGSALRKGTPQHLTSWLADVCCPCIALTV